jgi:hypothetical protein
MIITGRPVVKIYSRVDDSYMGTVAAKNLNWSDDLGGGGGGGFTVSASDPFFKRFPYGLDDAIVRIAIPLGHGDEPTDVAIYPTSPTSGTYLDADGKVAHQISVTLLSPLYFFHDWVVYPKGSISRADIDDRMFGWTDTFYDDSISPWHVCTHGNKFNSTMSWRKKHIPATWPDKKAYWIAGANPATPVPTGTADYFRTTITVTTRTTYRVHATADNFFTMYLNGSLFMASNQNKAGRWHYTYRKDVTLDPGDYVFAASVKNGPYQKPANNVMAFICSIIVVDNNGKLGAVKRRSDLTHWRVIRNTTPPRGMNAAGILLTLLHEADLRNVVSARRMNPTFDADIDSNGDDWEDVIDRTFPIATTHGDQIVEDLGDLAFDLDLRPNWDLNAYLVQSQDRTGDGVGIFVGRNLLNYSWSGYVLAETRMLVRTPAGWVQTIDAVAEGIYGRREGAIISGFSNNLEQGERAAKTRLEEGSKPRQVFSAHVAPVEHLMPYVDFTKGDVIWGLDQNGEQAKVRILSIGASVADDNQFTSFDLEVELEPVDDVPS